MHKEIGRSMGVWGLGSFDNDDAADYVSELRDAETIEVVVRALDGVVDSIEEYVEVPECERGIAAAEVVAALKGLPSTDLPDEVRAWAVEHHGMCSRALTDLALRALGRIRESSELKDLYIDADHLEDWLRHLTDLEERLAA